MTNEEINKARGCECLFKLDAQIKDLHGQEADLQLGAYMITDSKAEQWKTYTDLPPLRYKYKHKRKVHTGNFQFVYCPFCGKKKA